jgi:hypothetical protein
MADNPGPNAGTPGGPTQPNPSGNIQGAAQRAAVSPPATTAGVTQPGAATVPTAAQNDVVDLQFNGKTVVKIRLPESFDIRGAYVQFEKDHAHVTDKLGAFPRLSSVIWSTSTAASKFRPIRSQAGSRSYESASKSTVCGRPVAPIGESNLPDGPLSGDIMELLHALSIKANDLKEQLRNISDEGIGGFVQSIH